MILESHLGTRFQTHHWPAAASKGTVLIAHGMAEHGLRYQRLAQRLNAAGWSASALDWPGHGLHPESLGQVRGHFANQDGWQVALACLHRLREWTAEQHPKQPVVLFGHSMGSFLAQHYVVEHGAGLQGLVLSGSSGSLGSLRAIGQRLMRLEGWINGVQAPSPLANALSFKSFNKTIKHPRTDFDWLSRDAAEVDAYLQDPACGFVCSNRLWADLLAAGASLQERQRLAQIPKSLKILMVSGAADPVTQKGKGSQSLAKAYQKQGLNVDLRLYPEGRHELLHDTVREQVTDDILYWLG
jgi:alpha-beta hydrolase superfamily lysophospholipase